MVSSTLREVVVPVDDPPYYQNQEEENAVTGEQSYEYIDEFCINKPESAAVFNEPIDCITSGIQSCLRVVSNTDEEDGVESASPEKEGAVCVNPEYESKVRI